MQLGFWMKIVKSLLSFIAFNLIVCINQASAAPFYPSADIPSPVVHKAEFANVYLSNEVDFPDKIVNGLGLVVWRDDYQFVLVNQYHSETHAAHLTLGVLGSAIKGFNLNNDNSAKFYLIERTVSGGDLTMNARQFHAQAAWLLKREAANQLKARPPAIANLQIQGQWFNGDYPYYYFPDYMGNSGGIRWQYRSEGSLLAFTQPSSGLKRQGNQHARIRVYNDAGDLLRTEDVAGNQYHYGNKRAYEDGNFQYLTFEIAALVNGVESDPVSHRVKRQVTPLYTNNFILQKSVVGIREPVKISFDVDPQVNAVWQKPFSVGGTAAVDWSKIELSDGVKLNGRHDALIITGGVKKWS